MARWLFVYIMASYSRVLYTGVTNDLVRRTGEHRDPVDASTAFTARYRARQLVYYELVEGPRNAIAREKQIKSWTRAKRVALITRVNPGWRDLAARWPEIEELPDIER